MVVGEHIISVSGACFLNGECKNYIGRDAEGNISIVSDPDQAIRFMFSNDQGHIVSSLHTSRRYHPVVVDPSGNVLTLHIASNRDFVLINERIDPSGGRVNFRVPQGEEVTTRCNVSGFFSTHSDARDVDVPIWTSPLTFVFIEDAENPDSVDVIVTDCDRACQGKRCDESDGCGGLCGCPGGQVCSPEGECVNRPQRAGDAVCNRPDIVCGGICFGVCPGRLTCVRDRDGNHSCREGSKTTNTVISVIVWFIVFFAFVAGVWIAIHRGTTKMHSDKVFYDASEIHLVELPR